MKLLLDTHAFLWFVAGDERLTGRARRAMQAKDAILLLSVVSVWEMAIKAGLGRLKLPATAAQYIGAKIHAGLQLLPLDWSHAASVETLPFHHRDPFDRALIAQAQAEKLSIVTSDSVFRRYDIPVVW